MLDQLGLGGAHAGFEGDEGAGCLAPCVVRAGDHGGFQDGGVAVERALDLDRRNILAAGDDDVLGAVFDFDIAVGVHHGEVACMKPAALERGLGGFGVGEIAHHDVVAAHHDFADGLPSRGTGCIVSGSMTSRPSSTG